MKLGIVGNLEKHELPRVVVDVLRRYRQGKAEFLLIDDLAKIVKRSAGRQGLGGASIVSEKQLLSKADMLIAFGGDGTILRAARLVGSHEIPILGVNLGKLGFLTEISLEELDSCLEDVLEGKYKVEQRMMLQGWSAQLSKPFFALNDMVVDKYGSSRVMNIQVEVNDEYLATYAADGIILSTPTGSTAYSLANGGPIVAPRSQVITISPICPHTLTARPIIVPDESVIVVKIIEGRQKAHLVADGQLEKLLRPPAVIRVKKAPFGAKLVRRGTTNYFDVLRKKLHWGSDVRVPSKT